jgi:hypothetical protein
MPALVLNIISMPTYNVNTLCIVDASVYPTDPPAVISPTIEITPPGFSLAVLPFTIDSFNIFTSVNLGISDETQPLPDGIYHLKYSIAPAYENFVEKTILKVDKLQEKFDEAFMKLDIMECAGPLRTQGKVDLTTIDFFIQGAIAAANNCATVEAMKLYHQADKLLCAFIKNNCGCSGNNYIN